MTIPSGAFGFALRELGRQQTAFTDPEQIKRLCLNVNKVTLAEFAITKTPQGEDNAIILKELHHYDLIDENCAKEMSGLVHIQTTWTSTFPSDYAIDIPDKLDQKWKLILAKVLENYPSDIVSFINEEDRSKKEILHEGSSN